MDLLGVLENLSKNSLVFSAIRESRMRKDLKEKKSKSWTGRIASPSKMSFNECPYNYYLELDNPNAPPKFKNVDPESLVYKAHNGRAKHQEFQEDLRTLDVDWLRLFEAPPIEKIHPKMKDLMLRHSRTYQGCLEFPLYIEEYGIMSYIDAIVEEKIGKKWSGVPIVGDFKIKHYEKKVFKEKVAKNEIVSDNEITQMCVYLWGLKNCGMFPAPKMAMLWYYNSPQVGEIDAEKEYRIHFTEELESLTKYLLDEHRKAVDWCKINKTHDSETCQYKFCTGKIDLTRFVS